MQIELSEDQLEVIVNCVDAYIDEYHSVDSKIMLLRYLRDRYGIVSDYADQLTESELEEQDRKEEMKRRSEEKWIPIQDPSTGKTNYVLLDWSDEIKNGDI